MRFHRRDFGISATNMSYNIGERIVLCGRPDLMSKGSVMTVPTQTDALRSSKKLDKIPRILFFLEFYFIFVVILFVPASALVQCAGLYRRLLLRLE